MLAYAAHRRARRRLSPSTLVLIVAVHAVALGLLATAKMDVGDLPEVVRTKLVPVPNTPEPLPPPPEPDTPPVEPRSSQLDTPTPLVPPLPAPGPTVDPLPALPDPGPVIGVNPDPLPLPQPLPQPQPQPRVKAGPVLATPADRLRPPYPESKRRLEEEATLRLRLSIDERGRVTAVEPLGAADPEFLSAARAHLLRYWRYKPATEDGRAVATSLVVTLRFQLDDE